MPNTLFVGKVYHRFDKLTSTNDHALELIAKSRPPEGTVVRAAMQTAGRGQYGSRWDSAAGENLTISVILYPTWLDPRAQFRLGMAVAVATRAAVETVLADYQKARLDVARTPKVTIKWPNDIYLNDKKTAGILIQNTLTGGRIAASVVGIGLNVNQTFFPPELPDATSLARAAAGPVDLEAVSDRLLEALEHQYLLLRAENPDLRAAYLEHLYRLGVPAPYQRTATGETFIGTLRGVTPEGKLELERDGETEVFEIKEVRFLRGR